MAAEDDGDRRVREERDQRDADLTTVMSTPAGRRFVARLLRNAKLEEPSFCGEQTHGSAFNEGVREMGIRIKRELQRVCPKLMLEMLGEEQAPNLVHRSGDASAP